MDLDSTEHKFLAEDQITDTLTSCYKYTLEVGPETSFKGKIENKLWPESSQEAPLVTDQVAGGPTAGMGVARSERSGQPQGHPRQRTLAGVGDRRQGPVPPASD